MITYAHKKLQEKYNANPKQCKFCEKVLSYVAKNHTFCNSSCSAKYYNKRSPKRKRIKKCKSCNTPILKNYTYCGFCIQQGRHLSGGKPLSLKTLGEVVYSNDANRYNVIRYHSHYILKERKNICESCGYSKHVQVCHIKPIQSFDLSTLIKDINAKENLILLCPNCHWEYDHQIK